MFFANLSSKKIHLPILYNITDEKILSFVSKFIRTQFIQYLLDNYNSEDINNQIIDLSKINIEFENRKHTMIKLSLPNEVKTIIKKYINKAHLYIDLNLEDDNENNISKYT